MCLPFHLYNLRFYLLDPRSREAKLGPVSFTCQSHLQRIQWGCRALSLLAGAIASVLVADVEEAPPSRFPCRTDDMAIKVQLRRTEMPRRSDGSLASGAWLADRMRFFP